MKLTCPISGIKLNLPDSFPQYAGYSRHPIFNLPLTELNKLSKRKNLHDFSQQDKALLFTAFLAKTELVAFNAPLTVSVVTDLMFHRYFPFLVELANIYAQPKRVGKVYTFPHFSLYRSSNPKVPNDVTRSLISFLEVCKNIVETGYYTTKDELEQVPQEVLEQELEDRKKARAAIAAAKSARALKLPTIINWAVSTLSLNIPETKLQYVRKILDNYKTYPLTSIKEVKYLMLDYLPEGDHSDYLRKYEVLQFLDRTIVNKAENMAALASSNKELEAARAELSEVREGYTIVEASVDYINSAIPISKAIEDALDNTKDISYQALVDKPKLEKEPKPEDYNSRMAYNLAVRQWEKQQ